MPENYSIKWKREILAPKLLNLVFWGQLQVDLSLSSCLTNNCNNYYNNNCYNNCCSNNYFNNIMATTITTTAIAITSKYESLTSCAQAGIFRLVRFKSGECWTAFDVQWSRFLDLSVMLDETGNVATYLSCQSNVQNNDRLTYSEFHGFGQA